MGMSSIVHPQNDYGFELFFYCKKLDLRNQTPLKLLFADLKDVTSGDITIASENDSQKEKRNILA